MKRKVVLMLVVAMFAVIMAFAFVACDEESGSGSGTGDRIFTEDATYDEILTALQNAESVTFSMGGNGNFISEYYIITKNSVRLLEDKNFETNDYMYSYLYHSNGYYYSVSEMTNSATKYYDMYIDTCDFTLSIRNWLSELFEPYFTADKNGKITLGSYGEYYGITDYSIKMLGDRMEATWTEEYENEAGQVVRVEKTYIYSGVNSSSFDIPEKIRALEAEAEWHGLISYHGNYYRLMEDEAGSQYYVVEGGWHPFAEETINGLPVRKN